MSLPLTAEAPEVLFDPDSFEPVHYGPTWERNPETGKFILPERTLGEECLKWCHRYLRNPETGGPWVFTKEQARFVLWWYALDENNKFSYRRGTMRRMKGHGKDPIAACLAAFELCGDCRYSHDNPVTGKPVGKRPAEPWVIIAAVNLAQPLALDTRVRTTSGWKTMGEIAVGDYVFDENGEPQRVARETEVLVEEDCFRITFDDGQTVVASSTHGWTVERKRPKADYHEVVTITTEEMAATFKDTKGGSRIRIPLAGSPVTPEADLPLDPYLLGYWLGDGNAANAGIAVGDEDLEQSLENLTAVIKPCEEITVGRGTGVNNLYIRGRKGFCPRGHEKINPYVTKEGYTQCRECTLTRVNLGKSAVPKALPITKLVLRELGVLHNKHIPGIYLNASIEQRLALLQGLVDSDGHTDASGRVLFTNTNMRLIEGFKELAESLGHSVTHRAHGTPGAWIASFKGWRGIRYARLDRKQAKIDNAPVDARRISQYRRVKNVERVASVPVKCIGIDTPSHLFQVEGGILTHNTQTTAKLFEVMFNDLARKHYRLKIGAEQVLADGGIGKIQCVTSSPGMLESFRPSFIIANEVHHWLAANDGHEMAKVLRRIAGKKDSRVLSLTNAYQPGMDSVGQQDWEGYLDFLSGRAMDTGVLYDSLEAPPEAPLSDPETIAKVLMKVRGDSTWFPVDRIVQEILDPQTAVSESRRFYYNQIVSLEDALVAEGEWAPCRDDVKLNDGDEIVLGLDGGKTDDSTVLVALRLSDRAFFRLHSQEKPRSTEVPQGTKWTADLERVDGAVANAFGKYQVRAFFSDVHPLESYVDKWSNDYRDVLMIKAAPGKSTVGFDMRGNQQEITRMNMSLVENIRSRAIKHPGDPVLTQHVLNCYQRQNAWGVIFGKESRESERKVDAYAAMLLAFIAMNKYLESGKRPEKPQGKRGWIF